MILLLERIIMKVRRFTKEFLWHVRNQFEFSIYTGLLKIFNLITKISEIKSIQGRNVRSRVIFYLVFAQGMRWGNLAILIL